MGFEPWIGRRLAVFVIRTDGECPWPFLGVPFCLDFMAFTDSF